MRPHAQRSSAGFTLIELMVVVMIIGILATVAIPAYRDYVGRARLAEAFTLAEPAQKAVRDYYARWGTFPESNAAAGLSPSQLYLGRFVQSVEVSAGGTIRVLVKMPNASPNSVYLRPALPKDHPASTISWVCNGGTRDLSKDLAVSGDIGKDLPPVPMVPTNCKL